jgi:predicted Ser/Thr protein kinase
MDPGSGLIASRYRVIRELGRGGMGVVYVVEHVNTGDQLALKLLLAHANASPETVERFKREARAPAKIRSEHVVRVTDADVAPELDHAPFLVMELLDGHDLEKHVETRGAIPPEQLVEWLAQVARALDKAHAAGIVHRDLKPENLFLHRREDGTEIVKILDFGISKVMGGEGMGSTAQAGGGTKTGAVFGTPLYMAPEQARGLHSQIGAATDIWAIGLIVYRLLTGHVYWRANTIAELLVQIIAEPMVPPTSLRPFQLTPAFDAWFARSCAREPAERFRSVGEQTLALAEALGVPAPGGLAVLSGSAPLTAGVPPAAAPSALSASPTPVALDRTALPSPAQAPTAESAVAPGIDADFGRSNASVYSTVSGASAARKASPWPLVVVGAFVVVAATVGTVLALGHVGQSASAATSASNDVEVGAATLPPTAQPTAQTEPSGAPKPAALPVVSAENKPPAPLFKPSTKLKQTPDAGGSVPQPATEVPPLAKPVVKKPASYNPEAP